MQLLVWAGLWVYFLYLRKPLCASSRLLSQTSGCNGGTAHGLADRMAYKQQLALPPKLGLFHVAGQYLLLRCHFQKKLGRPTSCSTSFLVVEAVTVAVASFPKFSDASALRALSFPLFSSLLLNCNFSADLAWVESLLKVSFLPFSLLLLKNVEFEFFFAA